MPTRPLKFLRNLGRTREIVAVLLNYGFDDLVSRLGLKRYLRFRRRRPPQAGEQDSDVPLTTARRIRLALQDLGPTFVKFGQILSTRPDIVPRDVIDELKTLQEQVPPFPSELAIAHLQREFGKPVDALFAKFDRHPLAAGSLAQVHRAWSHDGLPLAVKIRRPSAVRDVERDLSLMHELATLIERHIPEADVFDPVGLVNHFGRAIRRELNFFREGRTVEEFRRLFRNDATLYLPRIDWSLTSESVLTMEFIDGCHVSDTGCLKRVRGDLREVASNGARVFMKQVFEFGIFHSDPHPGNVRVRHDGTLALIDFGMIGILDEQSRDQLVDLFVAVSAQDIPCVVDLIEDLGIAGRAIDRGLLKIDVRDFITNYYNIPLEKLNVGNMLTDFVLILGEHRIRCPANLTLLIRAVVALEGVGRSLDSDFNLASHLAPFVQQAVADRYSPMKIRDRLWKQGRSLLEIAEELPRSLSDTLAKINNDEVRVQLDHRGIDFFVNELDRSGNRLVVGLILSALIVASALIIRGDRMDLWFGIPVFIVSSFLGMWLIYGIFRSGRL